MKDNYILLATHADDELINMYGFIDRNPYVNQNSSVILITGGDLVRTDRFTDTMKALEKDCKVLPFYPDALLSYDRKLVFNTLYEVIDKLAAKVGQTWIVIPSLFDTHPEHLLVSVIGLRIAAEQGFGCISCTRTNNEKTIMEHTGKSLAIRYYYPEEYKNLTNNLYFTNGNDTETHSIILKPK